MLRRGGIGRRLWHRRFLGSLLTVSLVGGVPPYGYSLVGPAAGVDVDDGGVVNVAVGGAPAAGTTMAVTVRGGGRLGSSADMTVTVIGAADVVVGTVARPLCKVGGDAAVGDAGCFRGVWGLWLWGGAFGVFDVTGGAFVVRVAQSVGGDVVATVSILDEARGRVASVVLVTTRFYSPVVYSPDWVTVRAAVGVGNQVVYRRPAQGGAGEGVGYAVDSVVPSSVVMGVGAVNGRVSLVTPLVEEIAVSVVVRATDAATGETAVLTLVVVGVDQPAVGGFEDLYFVPVGRGVTLVTLQVAGGSRLIRFRRARGGRCLIWWGMGGRGVFSEGRRRRRGMG